VLDVADMRRLADRLGNDVTRIEVDNGLHDLMLSNNAVRTQVYAELFNWLGAETGDPHLANGDG
jgi:alpha-beta hydrolase superfamily lysophospholipase